MKKTLITMLILAAAAVFGAANDPLIPAEVEQGATYDLMVGETKVMSYTSDRTGTVNFQGKAALSTQASDYRVVKALAANAESGADPVSDEPPAGSVARIGTTYYTTLAAALEAAQNGDTVALVADISDVVDEIELSKSITLDGAGHTISAKPVTEAERRDVLTMFTEGREMFRIHGASVTVKNVTLDNDATHRYTYLIESLNVGAALTVENVELLNGGELSSGGQLGVGYGSAIHVNNAALVVKNGFKACSGGETNGIFPFTAILPEGSATVEFDLEGDSVETPKVSIGDDLLLVGMVGVIPLDQAQVILDYMKVPTRFVPYTLTLGDGSAYAFTGASPRTWNEIIDYGKKIMDVSAAIGYEGMDKTTTPVEVGLLTDTTLPATFTFEDANFTVNGNGQTLTGTIVYKDSAGVIKDTVFGDGTVLDLRQTSPEKTFDLDAEAAPNALVTVLLPDGVKAGDAIFTWDDDTAPDFGSFAYQNLPDGYQVVVDTTTKRAYVGEPTKTYNFTGDGIGIAWSAIDGIRFTDIVAEGDTSVSLTADVIDIYRTNPETLYLTYKTDLRSASSALLKVNAMFGSADGKSVTFKFTKPEGEKTVLFTGLEDHPE